MGVEKFNSKPWHDNHNHAGRHSHEMRKQAAEYELQEFADLDIKQMRELGIINQPIEESVIAPDVPPERL